MHLSENHIKELITMIDTWQPDVFGTLTWSRVLERFQKKFGQAPTERTLRNQARVKSRFNGKKEELRNGDSPVTRKPSSLRKAAEIIQKLEARMAALEKENERIFHRLMVYQKNAMDHGMTQRQLERELQITKDTERNNKDHR